MLGPEDLKQAALRRLQSMDSGESDAFARYLQGPAQFDTNDQGGVFETNPSADVIGQQDMARNQALEQWVSQHTPEQDLVAQALKRIKADNLGMTPFRGGVNTEINPQLMKSY